MGLFLVLFWCAAVAAPVFAAIPGSARLTGIKFPFSRQRELACKTLIWLAFVCAETALLTQNRKNSRFDGKSRESVERPLRTLTLARD